MVALSIIPLVTIVGISVDVARGYMVKSRLSAALDAAALAGGRAFYLDTRDDDINMFFDANFPEGYMGAKVTGPQIAVDTANESITVTASAQLATSFMSVVGLDNFDVASSAEITRSQTPVDVVLAIDMSGSMGNWTDGQTRIAAARTAAKELVQILFGSDTTSNLLKIGLVPWNGKVNITTDGTVFNDALTTSTAVSAYTSPVDGSNQSVVYEVNNSVVPLFSAPPTDWKGCVFNRYVDDIDDTNDADIFYGAGSFGGTDWVAWEPIGPEGEPIGGSDDCDMAVGGNECTRCLSHGVTPLQNSKTTINSAIDDLQNPTGTTNIPGGLGWAWRVLMPGAPFTEAAALADPDKEPLRAIVLLTDGENFGGSGDGYKTVFGYGGTGNADMNSRLESIAANIKADGVIIYTVQFANSGTSLQTLMKTVASGPNAPYYNYAPDSDTLSTIFKEVGSHISELRLTK
ncbi:vWA domain-containing protein [Aestuariispira insulae]|nr:pilus assembly protein TadG-related protein [Aestuariispira insulae]